MLDFLTELCHAAGEIQAKHLGGVAPEDIELKGPRDLVSFVDRQSEDAICSRIRARFPDDAIYAEESGAAAGSSGVRWIIDPLDGTTNYLHSIPLFAVSIAREVDGVLEEGAVFAPALDELYLAARGQGATCNGKPLAVSPQARIEDALLATGFADNRRTETYRTSRLERVLNGAGGVRRMGAAAMDLCMVARGSLDGFWEWNLSAWDVAAGGLILREAGGRVSDGVGGDDWLDGRSVVATNGLVHEGVLGLVAEAPDPPRMADLQDRMRRFVRARGWEAWHSPKNLAMAASVECAELTELFQWLSSEEAAPGALPAETRAAAGEEMADVLAYLLSMSNALGLDLGTQYLAKMEKNAAKYPPGGRTPEGWGGAGEEGGS